VITAFLSQLWVQRLGWTLLHFLWQGTAIVMVYAMLRGLLARRLSAQGRYVLAGAALGAMAIAPPLTFLLMPNAGGGPGVISVECFRGRLAAAAAGGGGAMAGGRADVFDSAVRRMAVHGSPAVDRSPSA